MSDSGEDLFEEEGFEDQLTPFHRAVASGDEKLVLKLIADGCDVNEKTGWEYLPLTLAIQNNRLAVVRILLNAGANYKNNYFVNKDGPLHLAARYGSPEIAELFIKFGVDVNTRNVDLQTPLIWATWRDEDDVQCKMIKTLIDSGSNINARDKSLMSPLSHAAFHDSYAAFQLLLSMGADIYIYGKIDSKILDNAAVSLNLKIVKWAVEHGYDINRSKEDGSTLLRSAACQSKSEIVEFLLNNGATMNIDRYNEDPLCYAVRHWSKPYKGGEDIERMKCLDLLIAHGANVNRVNYEGSTPLYVVLENFEIYKCKQYTKFLISILLKNGAELDFDHLSVDNVMRNTDESEILHLLLRHEAMFEAQGRSDRPTNFDLSELRNESRTDYAYCRDELELMKATKIEDTNVSYFNVLVDRNIGPYTRNENIRNALEESDLSKRFPIYSDLLSDRFSAKLKFQELSDKAAVGLGRVLNWNVASKSIILNNILYYLDKKDLTNLALI